jgi:hypothetical protein
MKRHSLQCMEVRIRRGINGRKMMYRDNNKNPRFLDSSNTLLQAHLLSPPTPTVRSMTPTPILVRPVSKLPAQTGAVRLRSDSVAVSQPNVRKPCEI